MKVEKAGKLAVTVSVLTRRRPRMLAALIESWCDLSLPKLCDVTFLVVENDEKESCKHQVEAFLPRFEQNRLRYVCEKEPGIPFARNRAAKEAMTAQSDLLIFVDDDEVVAKDWLVKFIDGYRNSPALLLGAPLRIAPIIPRQNYWQERMYSSMKRRYLRKETRASRLASLSGTPGVTIVTNNWLCHLSLFSQHGIWFDETMRNTGGTDAKFYTEVCSKDLPTGWVEDAFVYETIPQERLSFWYQYRRGRDQSNTHFRRKIAKNPGARWGVIFLLPPRLLGAILLTITLLLTNGRNLQDLGRLLGRISGEVGALTGRRSGLYNKTTGF